MPRPFPNRMIACHASKNAPTSQCKLVSKEPVPVHYAHHLTPRAVSGVDRLSMSLFDAAVDLNPHQIEAALFTLESPFRRASSHRAR